MRRAACIVAAAIALAAQGARSDEAVAFTPAEFGRILAHGPWPPPFARDPSNRVSGKPEAVALGERLFFSPRLSGTGSLLCASCHETWRHYADGRARALGIEEVDRNTQSVVNVRLNRWFGWDGANDNLWAQSIRPLLEPREMNTSARGVAALVRGDATLAESYRKAFGAAPPADDEALLVDAGKALAAYMESLQSGRTPFDDFRDALERGERAATARYPARAQRGLRTFLESCASCHSGANFSDGAFHAVGVRSLRASGEPDEGRRDGVSKLLASRYNLLGMYSDAAGGDDSKSAATRAAGTERGTQGAFRTPSLRDVALTPPYMHDGSAATLCDVVRGHPARAAGAKPLSAGEVSDLVAFLDTLTATGAPKFGGGDNACR